MNWRPSLRAGTPRRKRSPRNPSKPARPTPGALIPCRAEDRCAAMATPAPPELPTPAEAEALMRQSVRALPVESRPLASLPGAVLAQSVRAERDQPPFDRVTMDGVAIASETFRAGQRRFRIAGTQPAGYRPVATAPGQCSEVMTGAVLPPGTDCVIPVEQIRVADGWAEIDVAAMVEPFGNVHTRGLDC